MRTKTGSCHRIMAPSMNVCQVNGNKSYVVMSELGAYMCEKRVSVALVQEPYVLHGSVRGLPAGFRTVTSTIVGDGTF